MFNDNYTEEFKSYKIALNMFIQLDWRWSTNIPMIQSLIKLYNPELVVESGIGDYSTPAITSGKFKQYIGIDTDKNWLDRAKMSNKDTRCDFRHHIIHEEITIGTFLKDVSSETIDNISNYYTLLCDEIKINNLHTKMFFVDGATCTRKIAICNSFSAFDIIAFHDCEPEGIPWYDYYFNDVLQKNYKRITYITPGSWTGCFIKKELFDKNIFKECIPYIKEWENTNNIFNTKLVLGDGLKNTKK